jgi:nucleoid-associated protein YgaU
MPNDVKLGLVIGVGLVIAVAVIFFRKDSTAPNADGAAAIPTRGVPPAPPPEPTRNTRFRPVSETVQALPAAPAIRRHKVQEGETLFSLAQRYYGDGDRFADLYRVNRGLLKTPDALQPGMELVIPELPRQELAEAPQ